MKRSVVLLLITMFSVGCAPKDAGKWIPLFDGHSLAGWKVSEHPNSVRVIDGMIVCEGPRAHAFYVGDSGSATFRNFELQAEVMTSPGANSGIFFHTAYQEEGWPEKGYEVQINNTHKGDGDYRELKKTGSLYGIRSLFKAPVKDDEWFSLHIIVRGQRVVVQVNGMTVVDYIEPEAPVGVDSGPRLSSGTFALQAHDPGSKVFFRDIKVKPLPDDIDEGTDEQPVVDHYYALISRLNSQNFPMIDYHVHLKGTLTLEDALAKSRRSGIYYGIAVNCGIGFPVNSDEGIYEFLESMQGQPVFVAMQAEGREWVNTFSREAIAQFDYVFSDALTFTDDNGKRTRLWIKEDVDVQDKQAFMDMYVDRIQSVINDEPIDIFVNPTFLPEVIEDEYDALWTEERMLKVIDAAVANQVAIEINARYRIPSVTFIKLGKTRGVKFAFGTNNGDENFGNLEYCLDMLEECGLTNEDMFIPNLDG